MNRRLDYLRFPFQIDPKTPRNSDRERHVREQIEQVIYTNPGERVFRSEFGAGADALVFEPNSTALWEVTRQRLVGSLVEALRGEVDPKTIQVDVRADSESGAQLIVDIRYRLPSIDVEQREIFRLEGGS